MPGRSAEDILSPEYRSVLSAFAGSRCLLGFDFDGTLAPLARDPDQAEIGASTRALMAELCLLYPCVVISGRRRADLSRRVRGLGLKGIVGDHGVEPFQAPRMVHRRVNDWRPRFEAALRGEAGVRIEERTCALAIHIRHARAKGRARRIVDEIARGLEGAKLAEGRDVLSIVPAEAQHKGIALERERARLRCDTAIYIGDGGADEDVFELDQPGRLLTIRIGRKEGSCADFCLRGQRQVDVLLRRFIDLRRARRARSNRSGVA